MQHPDPADLAVLALGDHLDEDGLYDHVLECDRCSDELTDLRVVVDRASREGGPGPGPSASVWAAVLAEVGPEVDGIPEERRLATGFADPVLLGAVEDNSVLDGVSIPVDPAAVRLNRQDEAAVRVPRAMSDGPAGRAGVGGPARGSRTPAGSRAVAGNAAADHDGNAPTPIGDAPSVRSRRRWMPLLAAAVVGVVAGGGVVALATRGGVGSEPAAAVLASTALTPVPGGVLGSDAGRDFGVAEVVQADGTQWVKVSGAALPPTTASYEVWLIGNDDRMVSLGALHDGSGTFTIPAGIDYTQFPVVDISVEPPDGVPTHSGDSLVRGTL